MSKKRTQKQTLKEFHAWLDGVEELQSDDWHPTKTQWELIRTRIYKIKEEPLPEAQTNNPIHDIPRAYPTVNSYHTPPPVGGVPNADIIMSDEAKQMLKKQNTGTPAKTPDLDTSDGNFTSSFS